MFVEGRGSVKQPCRVGEGVNKTVSKAEKRWGDVAYLVATAGQSFPCEGYTNIVEALINSGDLTPHPRLL